MTKMALSKMAAKIYAISNFLVISTSKRDINNLLTCDKLPGSYDPASSPTRMTCSPVPTTSHLWSRWCRSVLFINTILGFLVVAYTLFLASVDVDVYPEVLSPRSPLCWIFRQARDSPKLGCPVLGAIIILSFRTTRLS